MIFASQRSWLLLRPSRLQHAASRLASFSPYLIPRPLAPPRSSSLYTWCTNGASPEMVQVEAQLTEIGRTIRYSDPLPPREPTVEELESFQERLGHVFSNRWLLRLALTHSSAAKDSHNAELSWLGDAALGLLATEQVMAAMGAGAPVGQLAQGREQVVSRQECARRSHALGLDRLIVIGQSLQGQVSQNMLAELFEAVVGAVYTDAGMKAVRVVYMKNFQPAEQPAEAAARETGQQG